MTPLDLTKEPPRSPYEKLGGLYMLARTIDKLRALLPGGNPGAYHIDGFSRRLLDALKIPEDDLRAVVAPASSDEEIAAWVREHSDPSAYAEINESMAKREVGSALQRNPDFDKKYPQARRVPPEMPLFDLMLLDDAESFSTSS